MKPSREVVRPLGLGESRGELLIETPTQVSPALQLTYKQWIALVLCLQQAIGASEGSAREACMARRGRRAAPEVSRLRKLLCSVWTESHRAAGGEQGELLAMAWLTQIYQVTPEAVRRWQRTVSRRDLFLTMEWLSSGGRWLNVQNELTGAHVRAAIGAGWTGRETRSTKPWRAEAHLLQLARTPPPVASPAG